jgi:hypothetical protein
VLVVSFSQHPSSPGHRLRLVTKAPMTTSRDHLRRRSRKDLFLVAFSWVGDPQRFAERSWSGAEVIRNTRSSTTGCRTRRSRSPTRVIAITQRSDRGHLATIPRTLTGAIRSGERGDRVCATSWSAIRCNWTTPLPVLGQGRWRHRAWAPDMRSVSYPPGHRRGGHPLGAGCVVGTSTWQRHAPGSA